jgi:hypothetical protein
LRVVLLLVDVLAGLVFHVLQMLALFSCHRAVGLGLGLDIVDMGLLLLEAIGLARVQLAGCGALRDAGLLVRFALIDARGGRGGGGGRLGESRPAPASRRSERS